jgi:hypothetical protein
MPMSTTMSTSTSPGTSPSNGPGTDSPARVPATTIGELEANYSMYCKALRMLIREGRSLTKIQRTVCWDRLNLLHQSLPGQYKDPDYLYALLKRELSQAS